MKTVTLKRDCTLQYFRYWGNGPDLQEPVISAAVEYKSEEVKNGTTLIVEVEDILGQGNAILSDQLDSASLAPSNKHHYFVTKKELRDNFFPPKFASEDDDYIEDDEDEEEEQPTSPRRGDWH